MKVGDKVKYIGEPHLALISRHEHGIVAAIGRGKAVHVDFKKSGRKRCQRNNLAYTECPTCTTDLEQ